MKVELGKIGSFTHGAVLSRIKPKGTEEGIELPVLTIRQLLLEEEGESPEQQAYTKVSQKKRNALPLAREGMIVIGLTSFHKAVVLTAQHKDLIIPSNFLILEFPGGIMDANYFAWYFNEHPGMKQMCQIAIQGDSKVKVLSIHVIRKLTIDCPDLVTQMAVGNLYRLQRQKDRLWKEKLRLEMRILTEQMRQITGEEEEI
ncbi:MAG: hypothetical protein Q4B70_08940 [Lachnospiraceae bacterium]|nr:hypothetical protein [Lachnospiraceae bacterium]